MSEDTGTVVGSDGGSGGFLASYMNRRRRCPGGFPWMLEVGDSAWVDGNSCVEEVAGVGCSHNSLGAVQDYDSHKHGEGEEIVGNRRKARVRDEDTLDGWPWSQGLRRILQFEQPVSAG